MHEGAIWFWPAIIGLIVVTALLTLIVPSRLRGRIFLLWFAFPAFAYTAIALWEVLSRPPVNDHVVSTYLLGFSLISAILLPAWLLVLAIGFTIGLVLRKIFPAFAPTADPTPMVSPARTRSHADPAKHSPQTGRLFHFEPRWKEELVVTAAGGSFILEMPMGILAAYLPTEEEWHGRGPEWAQSLWPTLKLELEAWCLANQVQLHIDPSATVYSG